MLAYSPGSHGLQVIFSVEGGDSISEDEMVEEIVESHGRRMSHLALRAAQEDLYVWKDQAGVSKRVISYESIARQGGSGGLRRAIQRTFGTRSLPKRILESPGFEG